ncbi:MAG TPA: hypothetical protein VGB71_11240 [Flavisolibacter sp.]|jgi:hypothetical protein
MKKIILSLCGLVSFCVASAQFSVGLNGNFTKYGGYVSKSTPGFGVRAAYEKERYAAVLSFTNGFAITEKSSVDVVHNTNFTTKTVASEVKLNFKTISFMGNRTLIGDEESAGNFYVGFGASFVMAKYSEVITESYDKAYTAPEMESGSENGLTINGLVGGSYKLGKPAIFGEVGFAFPANKVGETFVENAIPAHLVFNLGVKFTFGGE